MKHFLNNLLTENEQKILLFIVGFAFLGLLIGDAFLKAEHGENDDLQVDFGSDYPVKYDLQTATKEELITIPGIGEKRATDILNYRSEKGFQNKIDLMNVKGIGKATYLKIESYFNDLGTSEITEVSKPENIKSVKVNINTANAETLTKLTGIGPAKAQKIIALRLELGRFSTIDELLQVKGIGPKSLAKMKDQIVLDE